MNQAQDNQEPIDEAARLAQEIVTTARAKGAKAWVGVPPSEELQSLKAEKAQRDLEALKRHEKAEKQKLARMKEQVLEMFRKKRESQE